MTYLFLCFVSINICEQTPVNKNCVNNDARGIINYEYAYCLVQMLLFIYMPTKRKHKEGENYRSTDIRLSQKFAKFAAGVDSPLGSLHHVDVGIVSDDSGCMLPPSSKSKLKMKAVCTSEKLTLPASTWCKGKKAAMTSVKWFIRRQRH
jgi:hypothetical protein